MKWLDAHSLAVAEASAAPWHLMRNGTYSTYSSGVADEIAIYSSALSASSVKQHFDAGKGL